jgi:inhibitor of cysteine peptidase
MPTLASVESVELQILESFPVQVRALVRGHLADGCTEIDQIEQRRDLEAKTFEITISTSRDPTLVCTMALVPFEETIPLDVRDLPAGIYTVDVNGVQASFELQTDNTLS